MPDVSGHELESVVDGGRGDLKVRVGKRTDPVALRPQGGPSAPRGGRRMASGRAARGLLILCSSSCANLVTPESLHSYRENPVFGMEQSRCDRHHNRPGPPLPRRTALHLVLSVYRG